MILLLAGICKLETYNMEQCITVQYTILQTETMTDKENKIPTCTCKFLGAIGRCLLRASSTGINWVQKLTGIANALAATGGSCNSTWFRGKALCLCVTSRNRRHDGIRYGIDVGGTVHHLHIGHTGADVRLREVLLSGIGCR